MINKLASYLIDNNITISFAESCTGGALASTLTKIPGVSKIFKGSFVTYSIEYKHKYLGVKYKTISNYGVVSKEVALEMVKGLSKKTKSNICVSVTGNAGPSKGDPNAPVGKVFVGLIYNNIPNTYELSLDGEREEIINKTVEFIYQKITDFLNILVVDNNVDIFIP